MYKSQVGLKEYITNTYGNFTIACPPFCWWKFLGTLKIFKFLLS